MNGRTYLGHVTNGQIRLNDTVRLRENARVYVVVPDEDETTGKRIPSPRLARPEQAADFRLEVIEESPDADI